MTNRTRIRIAENGTLVRETQFPYRIDRDSVSRGVAYGSRAFIENLITAVLTLQEGVWMPVEREYRIDVPEDEEDYTLAADELVEHLDAAAPEGTRFGTNEGDASDYCFWSDPPTPVEDSTAAYPGQGLEDTREGFLDDIIITAVEGGINYWALVTKYKHPEGGPASVIIHETTPSTSGKPVVVKPITRLEIEAAIARILDLSVSDETLGLHASRRDLIRQASAHNDAGNIDADEADNIMQIAVFGEVVYG